MAGTGFETLASGRPADAGGEALPLNADAAVLAANLAEGETARLSLQPGRAAYLVVARGQASVNGQPLEERDAAAIAEEDEIAITARDGAAEIVLVEVAG
jgi:redox-sensitive bicupin YhaK (pirin superfamily)